MAKSKLLQDLVTDAATLESILLRLKVITRDLEDEKILEWIDGELKGYKDSMEIPEYRILKGIPNGSYVINYRTQYTNSLVPLETLISKEDIEQLVTLNYSDSINAIQSILGSSDKNNLRKPIPTDYCHAISKPNLQILLMNIIFSPNQIEQIVANVKSKLLDIIMILEETFENIDELDIFSQVEAKPKTKEQVVFNIQKVVYGDSTEVEIGDGNKIRGSKIGRFLGYGK